MKSGAKEDRRPLLAGVMGWPIAHSRSPRLFAHWFDAYDIEGHYAPLAVSTQNFAEVYRALPKAGFRGVNVTLPHKIAALELADEATAEAKAIGAANMIRFDPRKGIVADNTDGYGFIENLHAAAATWRAAAGPSLVLGAGGAARAVLRALIAEGAPEIRLVNRTRARAEALAAENGPKVMVFDWAERAPAAAGVVTIVNTTSLGMAGKPPLEMALDAAPVSALVTDLVYTPLETDLLARARQRGMAAVDGLGMLLHQARPAFRAWFGVDPLVDAPTRAACLENGA